MKKMPILESKETSKFFGDFKAVDAVNYKLYEGECAGIIGPNGAGKSTFFNLLTGMYTPSSGLIYYCDENITSLSADNRVSKGLVRTFQLVSVFNSLKVIENLILSSIRFGEQYRNKFRFFLKNARNKEIEEYCFNSLKKVGIQDKAEALTEELSYGDKRKLEIAMALSLNPKVLLLDEPLAGLSDFEIREIMELIEKVKVNFTLVIIEHKISRLVNLVSRLSVMHEGKLIADGDPHDVLSNDEVKRVYWGTKTKRTKLIRNKNVVKSRKS